MLPVVLGAAAAGAAAIAVTGLLLTPSATSPLPTPESLPGSGRPVPQSPLPLSANAAAGLVAAVPGTALSAADPVVAMTAWRDHGGLTHLTALGDGFNRVADAAGRQDRVALAVACGRLQADVRAAGGYDPVPDAAAQASWTALLGHGRDAAAACTLGALNADPAQLGTFTEQAALVRADLVAVGDRIAAVLSAG